MNAATTRTETGERVEGPHQWVPAVRFGFCLTGLFAFPCSPVPPMGSGEMVSSEADWASALVTKT